MKRNTTKTEKVRRGGALLLVALLSISLLAACGNKKTTPSSNKAKSKQSLNVVPGKGSEKKEAKKNDTGKSVTESNANNQKNSTLTNTGSKTDRKNSTITTTGGKTSNKKTSSTETGSENAGIGDATLSKTQSDTGTPVITIQPINALAVPGGSATFSLTAKDAPGQTFSWMVDKNDGTGWTDIPEANGTGYTITGATVEQNGWKYRCVVKNDTGSTESKEVTLYVREAGTASGDANVNNGSSEQSGETGNSDKSNAGVSGTNSN